MFWWSPSSFLLAYLPIKGLAGLLQREVLGPGWMLHCGLGVLRLPVSRQRARCESVPLSAHGGPRIALGLGLWSLLVSGVSLAGDSDGTHPGGGGFWGPQGL